MARVTLTPAAARQLQRMPLRIRARMLHLAERLERWPEVSGAKPLRSDRAGRYRLRTGAYRLQFAVQGETVIIEQVGHREGFYDE